MHNLFTYTGKVTITLGKTRISGYNKGTTELFRFFADALTGSYLRSAIPNTFKIISESNSSTEVSIQKSLTVGSSGETAKFSGYLTTSVAKGKSIKLCKDTIVYATLELDEDQKAVLASVTPEKSALIEWELTVGNSMIEENK